MAHNKTTYWDLDGLYKATYTPNAVRNGYGTMGRLAIFDADSGKKLFSCLWSRKTLTYPH